MSTRKAKPKTVAVAPPTAAPTPTARSQPLIEAPIPVRWRDLDAFNHVNNSTYLTYLEEARLMWLAHVPGPWFSETSAPVVAAATLNYRRPIEWPAQVVVELFCERLGTSSVTIAHRIVDASEPTRLYCDGSVVMVWIEPASGQPVALPEVIRGQCTLPA